MELIEDFSALTLGVTSQVRNNSMPKKVQTVEVETEEDYEKVCKSRWPDWDVTRMILMAASNKTYSWKEFYETLDALPLKWKMKKPRMFMQEFVQTSKRGQKRQKNEIEYEVRALSSGPVYVASGHRPYLSSSAPFALAIRKVLTVKVEPWITTHIRMQDYECSLWVATTFIFVDNSVLYAVAMPSAEIRTTIRLAAVFNNEKLPKVQCLRMTGPALMLLFVDNSVGVVCNNLALSLPGEPITNALSLEAHEGVFFVGTADGHVHRFALEHENGAYCLRKLGVRKYFDKMQIFMIVVSGNRIAVATKRAIIFEQPDGDSDNGHLQRYIATEQDPIVNVAFFGELVVCLSVNGFLTVAPFGETTYFAKNESPRGIMADGDRFVSNTSYLTITGEAVVLLLPDGRLCFWTPRG